MALAQGEVADEIALPEIYYAHATVLAVQGDEDQARTYLARVYARLMDLAAQLQDEAARQAYFHHNPTTRRLMQTVRAHGLAAVPAPIEQTLWLPALRDPAPRAITWTRHAGPADTALQQVYGSVTLRRAQLARLLQQAQAQGACAPVKQLAAACEWRPG